MPGLRSTETLQTSAETGIRTLSMDTVISFNARITPLGWGGTEEKSFASGFYINF